MQLASLRREAGRLEEARALLAPGIETTRRLGLPLLEALARVTLARVRVAEGGPGADDEARRDAEAAERIYSEHGHAVGLAQVAEARADLAEIAGDDGARHAALEEAARLHRASGDQVMAGRVEARLAEASRDPRDDASGI
jgi:hypothetical protein